MIAHSFEGAAFGPAQRLHGATYVVDLELSRRELDDDGIVCDIGALAAVLKEVVGDLHFRNLDEAEEFAGVNTTTEALARWIAFQIVARVRGGALGDGLDAVLDGVKVTLTESHLAWASYETGFGPE